jgi:hypothetical protein
MGELGDDIIFSVDITGHYDRLVENGGTGVGRILRRKGLDTSSDVYRSIWGNVYFPLQQTATTQINTNAPKMTGKLRKAMKESIKVPLAGSFPLVMILNTAGVDYAKPVEKMSSAMLKHPTPVHSNTRRIGGRLVILVDPEARKGWYALTLLNSRNRARKLWRDYIKKTWVPLLRGLVKNPTSEANKMFRVKFR